MKPCQKFIFATKPEWQLEDQTEGYFDPTYDKKRGQYNFLLFASPKQKNLFTTPKLLDVFSWYHRDGFIGRELYFFNHLECFAQGWGEQGQGLNNKIDYRYFSIGIDSHWWRLELEKECFELEPINYRVGLANIAFIWTIRDSQTHRVKKRLWVDRQSICVF